MKKYEATIKMKPGRERQLKGKGLEGLFELIFYRKPSIGNLAKRFVEDVEMKDAGEGMHVSEWKTWIRENKITQKQFYDVVNKLKGIGMIRRERDRYILSRDFSRLLNEMADIWDAWRESRSQEDDKDEPDAENIFQTKISRLAPEE